MEQATLKAARRDATGKGAARQMRRDGLIPGVVYGMGKPTVNLMVSRDEVEYAMGHYGGANVLFKLELEGAVDDALGDAALIKGIQRHPVSQIPESVDFQWVSLTEKVQVGVRVILTGQVPPELETAVIDQIMHEAQVSCLPLEIPEQLTISIDGIELHETRTVSMLELPEGVEVLDEPDAPVVTCIPPRVEEEPDEDGELVEGEIEHLEEGREPSEAAAEGEHQGQ